jgi:hypothetical protein
MLEAGLRRCYPLDVRTTLTLDDHVAKALKQLAHDSRQPFKRVVNDTLQAGLAARKEPRARRYRLKPSSLGGVVPGVDLDRALRLADALEGDEIARKLQLRK